MRLCVGVLRDVTVLAAIPSARKARRIYSPQGGFNLTAHRWLG